MNFFIFLSTVCYFDAIIPVWNREETCIQSARVSSSPVVVEGETRYKIRPLTEFESVMASTCAIPCDQVEQQLLDAESRRQRSERYSQYTSTAEMRRNTRKKADWRRP